MQLDDEILQRYYDGDLSPVEERVVRARIEQDPSARARLQELEKLSELVRLAADDMSMGLDSDALFAEIERGIAKEEKLGTGARLRAVVSEWTTHKRHVVWPVAGLAAAAAAALIMLPARDAGQDELARSAEKKERVRFAQVEEAPKAQGTRVENVDFGQSTGTVFEIENGGVMTAVVWIADEEE